MLMWHGGAEELVEKLKGGMWCFKLATWKL